MAKILTCQISGKARGLRLLLRAATAVFLFTAFTAKVQAADSADALTVRVIQIDQTHKPMGRAQVWISKSVLRIFFSDFHTFVLATAPKWDLVYYNPHEHTFHKWNYDRFCKTGTTLSACPDYPTFPALKDHSKQFAGYQLDCFTTTDKQKLSDTVEIFKSKDVAPQAVALLSKAYRLPNLGGVPITAFTQPQPTGEVASSATSAKRAPRQDVRLQSSKIAIIDISAASLKLPPKLKETANESEISFPHSQSNKLIEIFTTDEASPLK